MEGDNYMKIIKFLTEDIYHYKIMKYFLNIMKVVLLLFLIYQTYVFLKIFDGRYFLQYGPSYFVICYAIVCLVSQPHLTAIIPDYVDKFQIYNLKDAPEEVKEKFRKVLFYIYLYLLVSLILWIITNIQLIIPTEEDAKLFFIVQIIEDYFPSISNILIIIFRICSLPLIYISFSMPSYNIVYFYGHISFQLYMLSHQIRRFNEYFENKTFSNCDDKNYHNEIQDRLHTYIKNCNLFIEYSRIMIGETQAFVFPYQIAGKLVLISYVVFYFSFEGLLNNQYYRLGSLLVLALMTLSVLAVVGQATEDITSFLLSELIQVDWYHWNESNKKSYLLALYISARPLKIKFSENISLNYKLGLEIIKAFYTAISVMHQLEMKKSLKI